MPNTSSQSDQPIPTSNARDYLLLTAFCFILFGVSMVSDRPLSVHEGVLPESAREMFADGDWVIPKRAGAPWLENPPLPQWVTVGLASLFGRCDTLWIVRLGPTLAGTLIALATAWMASRWFGRTVGLLSGFILATTCELTRYAWLAEDEIYLAAVVTLAVALFVKLEFSADGSPSPSERRGMLRSVLGGRSWWMLAFFVALGMTNLVKGLAFGTVMVLIPIGGFLLGTADWRRVRRYVWLWGWLAFSVTALAWPIAAYRRFPGVLELWNYDLGGRLSGEYAAINEPLWYYPVNLLWMLAPWTLMLPTAFWVTRKTALWSRTSPERFLWCWALLVPIVFSIPGGKHHHYLLHAIVPWAVLASFGVLRVRTWTLNWPVWARNPWTGLASIAVPGIVAVWILGDRLAGPSWMPTAIMLVLPVFAVTWLYGMLHDNVHVASSTLFVSLGMLYGLGHFYAGAYVDRHRLDVAFLKQVRGRLPDRARILVDMQHGAHRGDMCLFYLGDGADGLHNLTFLLDDRIDANPLYVITRLSSRGELGNYGNSEALFKSAQPGRRGRPADPLTLFRFRYRADVPRVSAEGVRINPMQAIYRAEGPHLGRRR